MPSTRSVSSAVHEIDARVVCSSSPSDVNATTRARKNGAVSRPRKSPKPFVASATPPPQLCFRAEQLLRTLIRLAVRLVRLRPEIAGKRSPLSPRLRLQRAAQQVISDRIKNDRGTIPPHHITRLKQRPMRLIHSHLLP